MSTIMKLALGWVVFTVVMVVIAYIEHWKTHHKFLNPGHLFMNAIRGFVVFIKSMAGIPASTGISIKPGDSEFVVIPEKVAFMALAAAAEYMVAHGIVYHPGDERRDHRQLDEPIGYARKLFDCENFATTMKHRVDYFIATNTAKIGKGIPTMVIGYVDNKRGNHVCFQIAIGGVARWFDVYAINGTFKELDLDLKEQGTFGVVGMG